MSSKKTLGLVLVISGFILMTLTGIHTISNPDIFTHIALGQAHNYKADTLAYTMQGKQWINMNPLYNSLVYALWSLGGAALVTLVHVLVVLASFIMIFRFARKWGGPLSQGLALLLCARLMLPVFNPGPGLFFLLFTALFLTLLYQVKKFNVLAASLLVLQILWTNMHPSFLFGPVLILFFAIENWQETRGVSRVSMTTPLTNKLLVLAVAAGVVTLVNPNFINLHRHVFANVKLLMSKEYIEWISLFSGFFPQEFFNNLIRLTLLLGAGGLITLQKRLPLTITLLALTGAVLTVLSPGMTHLFVLLAFPFIVLSFNAISEYLSRTLITVFKTSESALHTALTWITIVLIFFSIGSLLTNRAYMRMGSAARFGLGVEEGAFPVAAAGILVRDDFPEHIMNIAHDGGYIALQTSGKKIFSDTRISFYGTDFYKTLNDALRGQPAAWKTILSDYNPHAIVLNGCWPDAGDLTSRLIASRAWKLVYFDGATVILVRNMPRNECLINDPSIQQYGVKIFDQERKDYIKQSAGFVKAGNSSRLIGAGSIYLALNRPQEAEAVYSILVRNSPNMAGAWLGLGQSLKNQKQISKGLAYMEKAAEITPRNAQIWMGLYQAYQLKGDEGKMRKAADQINKFFKADAATVEQQKAAELNKTPKKPVAKTPEKPLPKTGMDLELPKELR